MINEIHVSKLDAASVETSQKAIFGVHLGAFFTEIRRDAIFLWRY